MTENSGHSVKALWIWLILMTISSSRRKGKHGVGRKGVGRVAGQMDLNLNTEGSGRSDIPWRSFPYRLENRSDPHISLVSLSRTNIPFFSPPTLKFPGYSSTALASQMCWAPIRMNVKGLFCVPSESEPRVPTCGQFNQKSHLCAHILTPDPPLL